LDVEKLKGFQLVIGSPSALAMGSVLGNLNLKLALGNKLDRVDKVQGAQSSRQFLIKIN